jgi:Amidohydrolase family
MAGRLVGSLLLAAVGAPLAAQTPIAITHVTVIDMTGAPPRADQTVVIQGRRIVSVGRDPAPDGATPVDGRGRYLIPGLWDMHVHLTVPGGEALLSLFVANGVTGVRDMDDSLSLARAWQRRIGAGTLVGPRMVLAGPYLEGGPVPIPHLLVTTPESGRAAVDSLAALGVDFVKVHNRLSRAAYFAIADEVKRRGLTFAGHLPDSVSIVEASDAGQRSLEHLFGFASVCSPEERAALTPVHPVQRFLGGCADTDPLPGFRHLAANGTWVVPTLVVMRSLALLPDTIQPADSTNRYRSPALRQLEKMMMSPPKDVPPGADVIGRRIFAKRVELLGILHRAGVPLMTGSDSPGTGVLAGFSLHDELALFVAGGISPMDALRAATYEPARYFEALDSLGTVEPGKLADLVLLDADPLADIHNTRRIAAVIWNGHLMDRDARRRTLARAEAAAREPGGR